MAPTKKRKSTTGRNGRDSEKLDELLRVVSKLSDELQLIRKQMKKKDRQILRLLSGVVPSADFQASCGCRSSLNKAETSQQRTTRFYLYFLDKFPTSLFTANVIKAAKDGTKTLVPVRVGLLDEEHNKVLNRGPLSSLRVDIFVAYGDFEPEDWTTKELETSRVPTRKDKGSLILGSCSRIMENSICTFFDLKFMDNSSWIPSKRFKLVTIVADIARLPDMVEIRPAVSAPFSVKDHRGKQYEKHSVPSPGDEVWRLRRIGRDGPYHKKLEEEGIKTVEEFLQRYYIDQSSMQKILDAKDGEWATIVEHAELCNPSNEGFRYSSHESKVELLFNCFYKLVSVSFGNQHAVSLDILGDSDKRHVEQLRRRAFEDQSKLVRMDSLTWWSSAKANPFGTATAQQGEFENEFLVNVPCYPQTPLFIAGETEAHINGAMDGFSSDQVVP